MIEDPFVVFVDAETCAGILFRLSVLPNAERAIGIDTPGQLEPEFVFFPHLAGIHVTGVVDLVSCALTQRL